MFNTLNPKIKAALIIIVAVGLLIGTVAAISAFTVPTNSKYPNGVPTSTPQPTSNPTASPSPSPTTQPLTNSFTITRTVNDTAVADISNMIISTGAYIGTVYKEVFTITSTANQPITVSVSAPFGTTGNMGIVWDATTQNNGYKVFLASNGATATMTMYVTIGSVGGDIPLVFTTI